MAVKLAMPIRVEGSLRSRVRCPGRAHVDRIRPGASALGPDFEAGKAHLRGRVVEIAERHALYPHLDQPTSVAAMAGVA